MLKATVLTLALALPGLALACDGKKSSDGTTMAKAVPAMAAPAADVNAVNCAKSASLVGENCRYSTGMMAQKVHVNGTDKTVVGTLTASSEKLDSHVAAPYVVDGMYVIANEVLDHVSADKQLSLAGKAMEIDGVTYFLVTGVAPVTS